MKLYLLTFNTALVLKCGTLNPRVGEMSRRTRKTFQQISALTRRLTEILIIEIDYD